MTRPATATLRIRLDDAKAAEAVLAGLNADDDAYVATRRDGDAVIIDCRAPDVAGLRRAVDDVLANLGIAEDVLSDE